MTNEMTFEETPNVTPPPTHTIGQAWSNLLKNPSWFIRYWNYKGAVLSGLLRAPIFLITYLVGKESIKKPRHSTTACPLGSVIPLVTIGNKALRGQMPDEEGFFP